MGSVVKFEKLQNFTIQIFPLVLFVCKVNTIYQKFTYQMLICQFFHQKFVLCVCGTVN